MIVTDSIDEYLRLIEKRPEYFAESDIYPIETRREILEKYSAENKVSLGVVYKSPYNMLVVDLISNKKGGFFTYERIIPTAEGRGVVCIPVIDDKLVLLRQYRHSIREYQLCFPRGFGENGLTAFENAEKELEEEICAKTTEMIKLGEVVADSGVLSGRADVILCKISEAGFHDEYEGIVNVAKLTLQQIEKMISCGEINDGFTLAALELYHAKTVG